MFKTPHFAVSESNPVFDFELRRIKRLALPNRLFLYGALWQMMAILGVAIFYAWRLLIAVYTYNVGRGSVSSNYGYLYYSYSYLSDFYSTMSTLAVILLAFAGLLALFGGLYYMAVSIHSINHQINSGHWELLRLTPMLDEDIYDAKLTTTEIRAWRMMNIEIAVRLAVLTLVAISLILPADSVVLRQEFFGRNSIWYSLFHALQERTLITLLQIAMMAIVAFVWLFEPRWRMRSLLALGLAISAQVRNVSMSSLGGFFGLIGFYVGGLAVALAYAYLVSRLNNALWSTYYYARSLNRDYDYLLYNNLQNILQFLSVVGFMLAGYLYYSLVRVVSQRRTLRHAFRNE